MVVVARRHTDEHMRELVDRVPVGAGHLDAVDHAALIPLVDVDNANLNAVVQVVVHACLEPEPRLIELVEPRHEPADLEAHLRRGGVAIIMPAARTPRIRIFPFMVPTPPCWSMLCGCRRRPSTMVATE